MAADLLRRILDAKYQEIDRLKTITPFAALRDQVADQPPTRNLTLALKGDSPRGKSGIVPILAEIKRKSPSKGFFPWTRNPQAQAQCYAKGGAAAISVVTDPAFFAGDTTWLTQVKQVVSLPILQKDFFIEPYQIWRARALGADACLLIAAATPGQQLTDLVGIALQVGLHPLVEVVDEEEHAQATQAGALLIGVNNRNLRTFEVDETRTLRLIKCYHEHQVCIAESGIHQAEQIQTLRQAGVAAFLIGEALMKAQNPTTFLRNLQTVSKA